MAKASADLQAAEATAHAAGASICAASAGASASQAEFQMRQQQAQRRAQLDGIVSRESQADARAVAQAAQASWRRAQTQYPCRQHVAVLQQAQLERAHTEVRASADGTFAHLDVRVGACAATGQAWMALVASGGMWVMATWRNPRCPGSIAAMRWISA